MTSARPMLFSAGSVRRLNCPAPNAAGKEGQQSRPARIARQAGFTLLEIILAMAILAGALVVLGEIMRLGDQNASYTRDETEAAILASSIMDQLLSRARPLVAADRQDMEYETQTSWVFSITIEPTISAQVMRVCVHVEQPIESRFEPAKYELYRWILNPEYADSLSQEAALQAQEAAAEAEAAAAAATSAASATGGGT